MLLKGSSRENQSSADGIYEDANSDTRYDKDAFNTRCTLSKILKYPWKTKQMICQSHNKCEYQQKRSYQVNKALSLIQVQLHRSPVTSKCLQALFSVMNRANKPYFPCSPCKVECWKKETSKLIAIGFLVLLHLKKMNQPVLFFDGRHDYLPRQCDDKNVYTVGVMISSINTVLNPARLTKTWQASDAFRKAHLRTCYKVTALINDLASQSALKLYAATCRLRKEEPTKTQ